VTESAPFGKIDIHLGVNPAQSSGTAEPGTPFRILILGDFTGRRSREAVDNVGLAERKPITVDRDNFDELPGRMNVSLQFPLGGADGPATEVRFGELDDFHPDRLFDRVPVFEELRRMRRRLLNSETFPEAAAELTQGRVADVEQPVSPATKPEEKPESEAPPSESTGGLLDAAPEATDPAAAASASGSQMFDQLIQEIVAPYVEPSPDPRQPELVAAVDEAIGEQMRRLLHHPDYQALESAWRSVSWLVRRLETDAKLKLHLLDVSRAELVDDLAQSDDLSQSGLFKLLEQHSTGVPGSEPFACLIGLYQFGPNTDDVATLGRMATIADHLQTPFIAAGSPAFAGCPCIAETPDPDDWTSELPADVAAAWKDLRRHSAAAAVALLTPRFLLRLPFGKTSDQCERFAFEEMRQPPVHADYLWGNPAVLAAWVLGTGFRQDGWQLHTERSCEIDGLPVHVFDADGEREQKPCAEGWLTERAAGVLGAAGLTPVLSVRGRDAVHFGGLRSLADPRTPLAGRWA